MSAERPVCATAAATVRIANRLGLHARPATVFAQTAGAFESDISVRRMDQRPPVDGKSVMHLMMLAATQGTALEIAATGADAEEALRALVALVEREFDEEE
jgi:phosphotransferase system HPr (HPr) family protein